MDRNTDVKTRTSVSMGSGAGHWRSPQCISRACSPARGSQGRCRHRRPQHGGSCRRGRIENDQVDDQFSRFDGHMNSSQIAETIYPKRFAAFRKNRCAGEQCIGVAPGNLANSLRKDLTRSSMLNIKGTFSITQAVARHAVEQKVAVSSTSVRRPAR